MLYSFKVGSGYRLRILHRISTGDVASRKREAPYTDQLTFSISPTCAFAVRVTPANETIQQETRRVMLDFLFMDKNKDFALDQLEASSSR